MIYYIIINLINYCKNLQCKSTHNLLIITKNLPCNIEENV